MRKRKSSGHLSLRAANDDAAQPREIRTEFPAEFPVTEIELEIVETYLSAIIAELAAGREFCSANDNAPGEGIGG